MFVVLGKLGVSGARGFEGSGASGVLKSQGYLMGFVVLGVSGVQVERFYALRVHVIRWRSLAWVC